MRIGCARVSTQAQDNTAQSTALVGAGCARIFEEKASAGRWDRPELQRLMDQLRAGDTLVAWKLDRLSRSLKNLLSLLDKAQAARAGFLSLTEAIDSITPVGRMMMQIVGSFAEFERAMLRERTGNGLLAARKESRIGGRRPKLTLLQQDQIVHPINAGDKTAADAARLFNVHPSTAATLLAKRALGFNTLASAT